MSIQIKSLILFALIIILALGILGPKYGAKVWRRVRSYIPQPIANAPVESDGTYRNIIFLHHSTGRLLIEQGNVRPLLNDLGYQFWDHGYNQYDGLVRPDGRAVWGDYRIPGGGEGGNTDVDGLAALFSEPVTDPPDNAFSRLLQHEVIITKSCYPNNALKSEEMVAQFKDYYLTMREVIDRHPDRLFILVTTPALHPLATNPEEATRARDMANWLTSDEFIGDRANLFVFDFFDELADPTTNTLRADYQISPDKKDSHPNELANQTIGPHFVAFIDEAVKTYTNEK